MHDLPSRMKLWIFSLGLLLLAGCAPNPPTFEEPQPGPAPTEPAPLPQTVAPAGPTTPQFGAKIGVLLPLSGKNAALGRNLHQAAEMGLFEVGNDSFTLMVENTATTAGADTAARKLLAKGANVLLGPLFGADVKKVAPIASNARVPLLAFTNDSSVAAPGTYVLGVTPQSEVDRVITYAASQGRHRVAVLAPNSAYGKLVVAALQDSVAKTQGSLAQMAYFDPEGTDFNLPVQMLSDSYRTQGFDALMIPEGGSRLRQIAPLLPTMGLDPTQVQMLGTSLWQNDPTLSQEPGLAGGWYPTISPERWQGFVARYQDVFGQPPDPRAALVYDAITLVIALGSGPEGRDYSEQALTNANGFAGVTGVFRLNRNGTVDRGLAVMELSPAGAMVRDPAPGTFAAAIN